MHLSLKVGQHHTTCLLLVLYAFVGVVTVSIQYLLFKKGSSQYKIPLSRILAGKTKLCFVSIVAGMLALFCKAGFCISIERTVNVICLEIPLVSFENIQSQH